MIETKLSAIEKALAAAKARKAAKEAAGITEETPAPKSKKELKPKTEKPTRSPKAAKEPKAKTVDPAKEAVKAERLATEAAKITELKAQRSERKLAREAAKANRAAASSAPGSAHMKKVEKVRTKLLPLSSEAELLYTEIIGNFGGPMVAAIAEHLKLHVRLSATQRATEGKALSVGTTVRIIGGEAKYLNRVGTVVKSQKLRSFVKVDGVRKDVYVFTADLKVAWAHELEHPCDEVAAADLAVAV